ncbi:hypothetical protein [Pedobacter sp. UC225_65]|uniref:hypothetical protein n=1 Tax=Pedobacter sp. UC225_65 TaxID=3350173 RepID=UPI00366C32DF
MKTLKMIPMLLLLLSFIACKKNKDNSTIAASELSNYQLVVTLKNQMGTDLRVFYFTSNGNEIIAALEGLNIKKTQRVIIKNDSFTFDELGNGSTTYKFSFAKDVNGTLSFKSVSFINKADISMSVEASYISKLSDIQGDFDIQDYTYENINQPNGLSFFKNTNNWRWSISANKGTYTKISRGAWKGTLDGKSYFALSIKENYKGLLRTFMLMKGEDANFYKFGLI